MFKEKPRKYTSPLEKNYHPKLDDLELMSNEGIVQYQSMIGAAQRATSLGQFNMMTVIMTMSNFLCISPRLGHLNF
jgi:hypothetical protein